MNTAPIKTGILSFGMSGKVFHAPFLHLHPGFELSAIVERSEKKALQFYPDIRSYDSVDALLTDPEIGPKVFKETPIPSSGLMYDLGPHLLDQMLSMFGMPLRYSKTLGNNREKTQVDDFVHFHLEYPQGLQVAEPIILRWTPWWICKEYWE